MLLAVQLTLAEKNDSKWLISLRNDNEFEKVIEPVKYYFVLFEFEDLADATNNNIVASIWEVDSKEKGFAFCMIDYYLNIRAKSISKAPFNMWSYHFKFLLTKPTLIYQSTIKSDGTIQTVIFPSLSNSKKDTLKQLTEYSQKKTITETSVKNVIHRFSPKENVKHVSKSDCLRVLEKIRTEKNISNDDLCDVFAEEIYLPLILPHKDSIPETIKRYYKELQ